MVNLRNQHVTFTIAAIVTLFFGFSNAVTIREALQGHPNLTNFLELLAQNKALEDILNTKAQKTLFVPTNAALVLTTLAKMPLADQQALVRYHILNGSHPATSFTAAGGATMKTYLEGDQFANLGGEPNVVFTSKFGDSGQGEETKSAQVFSGLGTTSAIEPLNITFDGGIIHAVDNLFSLPETCTSTATKAELNGLLTALRRTNLTTYVDTTPGITCFAPSDAAFNKAGSPEEKLSPEALTEALKYHTLQGSYIGYSDSWEDGQKLTTLLGDTVTVKRAEGFWWVNDVKVLKANVVTSNGVAHVLDGVLSLPQKTDNTTKPSTTTSVTPSSNPTETQGSGSSALRATTATLLGLTLPIVYLLL